MKSPFLYFFLLFCMRLHSLPVFTFDCGLFSFDYPSPFKNSPIQNSPHMVLKLESNSYLFSASYWDKGYDSCVSIWGYYFVEFEQHGEDHAKYGEKLINRLAEKINKKGFESRRLREYRSVYLVYPDMGIEVIKFIQSNHSLFPSLESSPIWRLSSAKLQPAELQTDEIWRMPTAKSEEWQTSPSKLFYRLNFSCLLYLTKIANPLKRAFYDQITNKDY